MAAHRYWRLYITANNGSSYCNLTELWLCTAIGGASVAANAGGTATASSSAFGWTPNYAFDGVSNVDNGWHSAAQGFPMWLQYDFGAGNDKDIIEFGITSRNPTSAATDTPKDFKLQYSDDGATWTDKFSIVSQTSWGGYETRRFSSSTVFVRKKAWRLNVTASNGSIVCVGELALRTANGGPSVATGGAAAASSTYSGSYAASQAFDGTASGLPWASNGGAPQWLMYTFSGAQEIIEYVLTAPSDGNYTSAPKTWSLQYQDTDGSWIDADVRSNQPAWTASEARTYTFGTAASGASRPQVFICT
jgi:hypothetical protein